MKFKKYNSIDNITRKKTLDYILGSAVSRDEWVQTLKIHGSNYSIWYDGNEIKYAKRSSFIGGDSFMGNYNFDYDKNVIRMYDYLLTHFGCNDITICGEIYGGFYNHPDVERVANSVRVQKGVQYRPDNDFIVFDIMIDGMFVNYDEEKYLCELFELPHVPELARGNFEDLINNTTIFTDSLYKRFDLPEIEKNYAEGWVMKPNDPTFFGNGSRVILKGKNPEFSEMNGNKKDKRMKPIYDMSENGSILMEEILTYVTENRLKNVLSHGEIDNITDKDFGKLMKLFSIDVFDEFMKDWGNEFTHLDKKEQHLIRKKLNKEVALCIRTVFLDIIDGTF